MAGDMPAVCLKDVDFAYDREPVLERVNLDITPGELACVVGPNGGGKSTLLKLILGALRPTRGRVRVFGIAPVRARHRVGYMSQHTQYDPAFPITVRDVVLMGRLGTRVAGWYSRADKAAADRCMAELEVADLARQSFAKLSGGQQQRVLIARAMVCEPDLLLLDEPLSNVDAAAEARFAALLAELARRTTVVMVSHDLKFVSAAIDKAVCVNRKVVVHPTSAITGELVEQLYGGELRAVRHDHDHTPAEHTHG